MARRRNTTPRFAIRINTDDQDLLTLLKIYPVLPDKSAEEINYVRVIDEEGEDYLQPRENFIFVDFPTAIERALLRASKQRSKNGHYSCLKLTPYSLTNLVEKFFGIVPFEPRGRFKSAFVYIY